MRPRQAVPLTTPKADVCLPPVYPEQRRATPLEPTLVEVFILNSLNLFRMNTFCGSPRFAQFWCNLSPFTINTCKSVSKETNLSPFRMNTYKKHRGGGGSSQTVNSLFTELLHLLSLLNILYPPKNGSALSAVIGASAKRAHRLQERRSLLDKDSVFRRRRRRRQSRQEFPSMALLDGVVRGHRKQRRRRFRPLNVRQCVGRISKTGIRMRALDVHLQVRRIPPLRHHGNRLLVADFSSRNRSRNPRPFDIHSVDRLFAQRFARGICIHRSSFPSLAIHNIPRPAWSTIRSHFRSHAHVTGHLPRHFLIGFQHVGRPRYWIADH